MQWPEQVGWMRMKGPGGIQEICWERMGMRDMLGKNGHDMVIDWTGKSEE